MCVPSFLTLWLLTTRSFVRIQPQEPPPVFGTLRHSATNKDSLPDSQYPYQTSYVFSVSHLQKLKDVLSLKIESLYVSAKASLSLKEHQKVVGSLEEVCKIKL